jgi:cytochrome P450
MSRSHTAIRVKRQLPPAAPLPPAAQTLGCRLWPHEYFERCRRRYGPRFTIYPTAMPPLVVLSDPAEIRAMFAASPSVLHPGEGAQLTTAFYGPRSFILCDEQEHSVGRAAIMPALRRRMLQQPQHSQTVAEIAAREIDTWPRDRPFPVHPYLRALTLRVILRSIFGEETPLLPALHRRILEIPHVTASLVIQQPMLRHLPVWHRTWRLYQQQRLEVYQLTSTILQDRRAMSDQREDLLGLLLSARDERDVPLSEEQILDHLVALMIAGHETTAAQLAWALQLLAHNQHALRQLTEEVDADTETAYLTATIQETMRCRCVFLFSMPRKVTQPCQVGELSYSPPTHLLGAIHLLHHDPTLFSDPEVFAPQRFLGAPPSTRIWIPWGGGQRRCPGQHLALQEMEIVLQALLTAATIGAAGRRLERGRWRNAIIVPHAGSRIILRAREPRRRMIAIKRRDPTTETRHVLA